MNERTLSIVKPDAVAKGHVGNILARFEKAGLTLGAVRMLWLSEKQARQFYAVHKERPFFNSLVAFMCSGPVVVSMLEGPGAIAKNRELMGATDPAKADSGTLRRDFGASIDHNAVHGSDGPQTAQEEVAFFFNGLETFSYSRST